MAEKALLCVNSEPLTLQYLTYDIGYTYLERTFTEYAGTYYSMNEKLLFRKKQDA